MTSGDNAKKLTGFAWIRAFERRKRRQHAIFIVSALVVAFVRHNIQYGDYDFGGSWGMFFGSWVIHYFVLVIVGAVSYVIIENKSGFFWGQDEAPKLTADQFLYVLAIIALVASVLTFVVHHFPAGLSDESY